MRHFGVFEKFELKFYTKTFSHVNRKKHALEKSTSRIKVITLSVLASVSFMAASATATRDFVKATEVDPLI